MDHSDPNKVKYFLEALDLKYIFSYPWGSPYPPTPYLPRPLQGDLQGGLNEGGGFMSPTPKCDMFLESP